MPTRDIQLESISDDDLIEYRGRWVALRAGHVVAAAASAIELRDRADVEENDLLLLVPTHGEGAFLF